MDNIKIDSFGNSACDSPQNESTPHCNDNFNIDNPKEMDDSHISLSEESNNLDSIVKKEEFANVNLKNFQSESSKSSGVSFSNDVTNVDTLTIGSNTGSSIPFVANGIVTEGSDNIPGSNGLREKTIDPSHNILIDTVQVTDAAKEQSDNILTNTGEEDVPSGPIDTHKGKDSSTLQMNSGEKGVPIGAIDTSKEKESDTILKNTDQESVASSHIHTNKDVEQNCPPNSNKVQNMLVKLEHDTEDNDMVFDNASCEQPVTSVEAIDALKSSPTTAVSSHNKQQEMNWESDEDSKLIIDTGMDDENRTMDYDLMSEHSSETQETAQNIISTWRNGGLNLKFGDGVANISEENLENELILPNPSVGESSLKSNSSIQEFPLDGEKSDSLSEEFHYSSSKAHESDTHSKSSEAYHLNLSGSSSILDEAFEQKILDPDLSTSEQSKINSTAEFASKRKREDGNVRNAMANNSLKIPKVNHAHEHSIFTPLISKATEVPWFDINEHKPPVGNSFSFIYKSGTDNKEPTFELVSRCPTPTTTQNVIPAPEYKSSGQLSSPLVQPTAAVAPSAESVGSPPGASDSGSRRHKTNSTSGPSEGQENKRNELSLSWAKISNDDHPKNIAIIMRGSRIFHVLNIIIAKHPYRIEIELIEENLYSCPLCFSNHVDKFNLVTHLRSHWNDAKLPCQVCKKPFRYRTTFLNHTHDHIADIKYYCPTCKSQFLTFTSYERHRITMHEIARFICPSCDHVCNSSTAIREHMALHKERKPNTTCKLCGIHFPNEDSFSFHSKNVICIKDKVFNTCNICSRTFSRKSDLRNHSRTHLWEKPFRCQFCGNTYQCKFDLVCHVKKHKSIERPHECPVCSHSSINRKECVDHVKKHVSEMLCLCCGRQDFDDHQKLVTHVHQHDVHGWSKQHTIGGFDLYLDALHTLHPNEEPPETTAAKGPLQRLYRGLQQTITVTDTEGVQQQFMPDAYIIGRGPDRVIWEIDVQF